MYLKKGKNKGVGDFQMVVKVLIFHASEYLGENNEVSRVGRGCYVTRLHRNTYIFKLN
jgi:hypothetical protein